MTESGTMSVMDLSSMTSPGAGSQDTVLPPIRPSLTFLAILAATIGAGVWLWSVNDGPSWGVFVFATIGWILSLTMHEFAHALMAWFGGDKSVAAKGYLQLDPRKYTEPGLSLVLPILFVLMGGIGLPGGAVWIQMGSIPNRWLRSAVSFAGPASLTIGLAFLGVLQIGATVLNLIPVPGLDGFGIINPHLSPELRAKIRPISSKGIFIVLALLWFVPPANRAFWDLISLGVEIFGVNGDVASRLGFEEYQFWR